MFDSLLVLREAHRQGYPRVYVSYPKWPVAGRHRWSDAVESDDPHVLRKLWRELLRLREHQLERQRPAAPTYHDRPPSVTPPPAVARRVGPDALRLRALRTALERVRGLGQWSGYRPIDLPPFSIRWDDPGLPHDKAACVSVFHGGELVLCLRSDLEPEHLHHVVLHELGHLHDAPFLTRLPRAELEARARAFQTRMEAREPLTTLS